MSKSIKELAEEAKAKATAPVASVTETQRAGAVAVSKTTRFAADRRAELLAVAAATMGGALGRLPPDALVGMAFNAAKLLIAKVDAEFPAEP